MKNRILVTGATGFLGSFLMKELLKKKINGDILIGVSRSKNAGRRWKKCDLTKLKSVQSLIKRFKPTLIYHLAGVPSPSSRSKLRKNYLLSTINLINSLYQEKVKKCRITLAGSVTVYGGKSRNLSNISENQSLLPKTQYGRIKLKQEQLVLAARKWGYEANIGRIFNLTGPTCPDHLAVGSWARQIDLIEKKKRAPIIHVGRLENRRDFIDVRDAAQGLIRIGKVGQDGEVYNVCSGRATSLKTLLNQLIQSSHSRSKIKILKDPKRFRKKSMDPKVIKGNNRKIFKTLNWKPKISLRKSLRDTLKSI